MVPVYDNRPVSANVFIRSDLKPKWTAEFRMAHPWHIHGGCAVGADRWTSKARTGSGPKAGADNNSPLRDEIARVRFHVACARAHPAGGGGIEQGQCPLNVRIDVIAKCIGPSAGQIRRQIENETAQEVDL